MTRSLMFLALSLAVVTTAAPASAAFFLEGLKPFTQKPACQDPYATDKRGCAKPDLTYPVPGKTDRGEAGMKPAQPKPPRK